jgi:membrane protease YdiL (CAAX protease family)
MTPVPVLSPFHIWLCAGYVLVALLVIVRYHLSLGEVGWRWGDWRTYAQGLGWGIVLGLAGVAWLRVLMNTGNYMPVAVPSSLRDVLLLVAVMPVAHELLFRGAILGSLLRGWRPYWAVVLSAVIYMIAHPHEPWLAFLFITGVGYALAFRLGRSIVSSILAHSLVAALLLAARMMPQHVLALPESWLLAGVLAAAGMLLCSAFRRTQA